MAKTIWGTNDRRTKYTSDTEKPVMVSVRLPRELYEKLERYVSEHPRMSISELLKDGAEMRLETEVDPRYHKAESTTEATDFQIDGASILRDIQATLERYEARFQALERQTAPGTNGLSDGVPYSVIHGNTATGAQERRAEPVSETNMVSGDVPPFDASKHHLGKLCPSKDEWGTTGQSLRNEDNQCLACKARAKREKAAQKRQAQAATK